MPYTQVDLDLANHQVMEGETVVAEQRALIGRLRQDGEQTDEAQENLKMLEGTLDQLKRHRDLIQETLSSSDD